MRSSTHSSCPFTTALYSGVVPAESPESTAGMSGSPVFQVVDGNHFDLSGNYCIDPSRKYKFLGIYSGRITTNQLLEDSVTDDQQSSNNALNIGIVWKPSVINQLITHSLRCQPIKGAV